MEEGRHPRRRSEGESEVGVGEVPNLVQNRDAVDSPNRGEVLDL